jgi:hypothetical protein
MPLVALGSVVTPPLSAEGAFIRAGGGAIVVGRDREIAALIPPPPPPGDLTALKAVELLVDDDIEAPEWKASDFLRDARIVSVCSSLCTTEPLRVPRRLENILCNSWLEGSRE